MSKAKSQLKDLTVFVEQEAAREGPAALAALQAERDRFRIGREFAEEKSTVSKRSSRAASTKKG